MYTYVILKTAANTYTVLYSQSQYSWGENKWVHY
jgi:hypothetical protein